MREKRIGFCAGMISVVSFLALSVTFGAEAGAASRLVSQMGIWPMGAVGLFWFYQTWLKNEDPFRPGVLWFLAVFFAGVATLAQSFAAVGTTELLTQSRGALLKTGLYFLGRVLLYFAGMRRVYQWLRCEGFEKKQRAAPLWISLAGALLVCWLPYFVAVFPGVVSNDSVTQLGEIFGLSPLSNGNPVFQTFLIWLCQRMMQPAFGADGAVALYCIVQGLCMAVLLGYLLLQMLRSNAPRWLVILSFLLYGFCPVFPLYAFCVGKDTNFAMAVLFFSLMVWRVLCFPSGKKIPRRLWAGLSLSAVMVMLLRNPGVYLVAGTLVLLLLQLRFSVAREGRAWRLPAVALLILVSLYGGLHGILLPSLYIQPMPETEEYSLPLQQVARVVVSQPERLQPEDVAIISAVLDYGQIKEAYNGELSDPVKLLWNEKATSAEKQAFFGLWLRLLPQYPFTYFSATFHNTYGYLCPGYVSTIKPTLLIGRQKRTDDLDPYFQFSISPHSERLKTGMGKLMEQPVFRMVIAPGLYGCITLFALTVLLFSKRRYLLIPAFPAMFSLLGALFSAVNGYFRYAMPLYMCAPLLLVLCAQALRLQKFENEKE